MKKEIAKLVKKTLKNSDITEKEIEQLIEIPPSSEMGDYAFPCFSLSKLLRKNPNQIAAEIKNAIETENFDEVKVIGGYLNFFLDREKFANRIVSEILKKKEKFGKPNLKKEKIIIEFSQPNTHKAFHVGHIRGTSLGESLARISEFCGNKVLRANYSGDTGMHVAKWLWCYMKYHTKEKLKNDESWISSVYVDAVKKIGENEELQKEVDEINRKLENKKDKKLNELWKKTRKLSIDSWKKIYKELNTKFDVYFFESQMEENGKKISLELLKRGIAEKSDGAVIMNLEEYGLGIWVLLRSDGTVLYSAKDIALAKLKTSKYKADKYLVAVADEQKLHFQQLLKTLELANITKKNNYRFITFGLVRLPEGKMSSRTGDNILYSEFMKEIVDYAKKEIKKRTEKISAKELEKRALKISIAAIKYSMLKQNSNKNIIFDKKDAMNFEGDTGPYILYSHARANSILKKSKTKKIKFIVKNETEEKEFELAKKLSYFPEIVLHAYENSNPSLIANYVYQLSQIFNEFYHMCPVIGSERKIFRLSLVKSFRQVVNDTMNLLGIEVLEEM
ncbi:MAG: arginine--tRNA ligase [Nanoarchaeota archaeon]